MKHMVITMFLTLSLVWGAYAQENKTSDDPVLYIGQDPATGDQVMSIGPAPAEENSTEAIPYDGLYIITPEIIWPQKNKLRPKGHGHAPRIRPGPNDPRTP